MTISLIQLEVQQTYYGTLLMIAFPGLMSPSRNCHFFSFFFFFQMSTVQTDYVNLYYFFSKSFVSVRASASCSRSRELCERGGNTALIGSQLITKHTIVHIQKQFSIANSPTSRFCEVGGNQSVEKPTQRLENRQNFTQAVTRAQDQTRAPGAVRRQHYPLHHHATLH